MEGNLNVVTRQNFRICRRCEQLRRADFRRPNVIPIFFFDTADIAQSSRQSLLCIADDTYLGCHRRLMVNYKVRVIVVAVFRWCSKVYKMLTSSHMSVGWLVKIGSAGGRQRRSQSEHAGPPSSDETWKDYVEHHVCTIVSSFHTRGNIRILARNKR